MTDFRSIVKAIFPQFIFEWYRKKKKQKRNSKLQSEKLNGAIITKEILVQNLKNIGIKAGDNLLVHSSLSKIGYLENGADTVIDALLEVIGSKGNLLMPSSPNALLQLDYIRTTDVFDVQNSPSKLGTITETFRKRNGVLRSLNPTEPVCAFGPDAAFFTEEQRRKFSVTIEHNKAFKILYINYLDKSITKLYIKQ